jgi:hypothetical protein
MEEKGAVEEGGVKESKRGAGEEGVEEGGEFLLFFFLLLIGDG